MKKLLFSSFIIMTLVGCKKETPTSTENTSDKDSTTATSTTESTTTPSVAMAEIDLKQANELLKTKQNDTLYVTNFFATWCGPCMKEIPHFKEKMTELKDKPVKFTFINLDNKEDWNTVVKQFGEESGLSKNIVLIDGSILNPDFFKQNFKTWTGESIPFTFMKKGDKTNETVGSMSKTDLDEKIASLLK